jgi:pimeloyl-ACP methyl ester carboxylesterase
MGPRMLHYTDWGRRSRKRVVLCVHGYSGNSRDFDALAAALSTEARVICVDVAGRGESGWLGSSLEYHFPQFLSDIDALIAHLGVREVDWIGTSMGGLLGLLAAARPGSRVRRLLMNDIGAYVPLDALREIGRNLDAPEHFASVDEIEAHLRQTRSDWGEISDAQWKAMAIHGSRRVGDRFHLHYDQRIARLVQLPLGSGLFFWGPWSQVGCPVLLVRGADSRIFPRAIAEAMVDSKRGTRLEEIEGCGHAPSLMAESHIEIVRDFIRWRVPSSSFRGSSRMPTYSPRRPKGSAASRQRPSPT